MRAIRIRVAALSGPRTSAICGGRAARILARKNRSPERRGRGGGLKTSPWSG